MEPDRGRDVAVVAALAVVVLLSALAGTGVAQPSEPYVYVEDQRVDGTAQVVVGNATLPDGGFLELRRGDNRAGEFVGATGYLEAGYLGEVTVPFEDRYYYTSNTEHVVIAIEDTDGDRELDGSDQVYDNGVVQDTFIIEEVVTPTPPEETPTRTATPDAAEPAADETPTAAEGTTAPAGAGADDGAENQLTADGGNGGLPQWLLGGGVLLIAAAGAALLLRLDDAWADESDTDTGEGATAAAGAGPTGGDRTPPDERRIERLLTDHGGRMKQAEVVSETEWSSDRVSELLSDMEAAGQVDRLRIGRETLVSFLDEDAGTEPVGEDAGTDPGDGSPDGTGTGLDTAAGEPADDGPPDGGAASDGVAVGTDWREMVPDPVPGAPDLTVEYDDLDIGEFVGGGGNADVYRATVETAAGTETLAVKQPRAKGTLHAEQVERFVEEAETWARLDDHEGIVGVVGWGSEPLPWLAMEYMDGGDLGERAGEVDLARGLWTAVSLAEAVRHAHRRGIAHLDLKPANVLFRECGGSWDAPKVTDWGLSKHLIEHSASVEGMTPGYAAPEQFDDAYGAADDITDVYGLGAVCYELFTGQPPYEGRPTEVLNAVLHEEPTPPSEVADLPPALDDVLLTALATEKADRYESVLYLRDDLQAILDDL